MSRRVLQHGGQRAPNPPFVMNKDSSQAVGLVGWWPIPTILHDFAERGNPTIEDAGKPDFGIGPFSNKVADCGLTNTKRSVVTRNTAVLEPTAAITVCAWAMQHTGFNHNGGKVVSKAFTTRGSPWLSWDIDFLNTGQARVGMRDATTLYSLSLSTFAARVPVHIALTYDGTTLRGYSQGIQGGSTAASGAIPYYATNLTFGGAGWASPVTGDYFDGQVWGVRIYNRALSSGEIWNLYNPATRWDLYREIGRRTYFVPVTGATTLQTLAAASIGVTAFTRKLSFNELLSTTAISLPLYARRISHITPATSAGTAGIVKSTSKTLSIQSVVSPVMGVSLLFLNTLSAVAVGVASLSAVLAQTSQTLTASALGVATISLKMSYNVVVSATSQAIPLFLRANRKILSNIAVALASIGSPEFPVTTTALRTWYKGLFRGLGKKGRIG